MSHIATIIEEITAAAKLNDQGGNVEAHAALLHGIQRLQLAAEKPIETAKRIIYQVGDCSCRPPLWIKTANLTLSNDR